MAIMIPYFLTSPALPYPVVEHGFFTRIGGKSSGCYATLNTSFKKGDDPHCVYENRSRICKIFDLSIQNLATVNQQHTNIVHFITKPFPKESIPVGDALITTTPNVLLGINTADCVPILLADKTQPIVAAVHAGWKGAVGGVIENTVKYMKERLGAKPENIVAALGPCIWQESYEVDQEFMNNLLLLKGNDKRQFFSTGKRPNRHDHYQKFDLPGYVTNCLNELGITTVSPSPANTFADEKHFFSFRRKTVATDDFGNQMSVICIKNTTTTTSCK